MKQSMRMMAAFAAAAALLGGCAKNELPVFDEDFAYIVTSSGADNAIVGADANATNTYFIYISCEALEEPLDVYFSISSGSGISEGVDYEVVTTGGGVQFLPGIWRMPVRIRWKEHEIDPSADNSLVIALTGTSRGDFTLGFPGPAAKGSKLKITKKNL